jgi:hypothetical protein
MNYFHIKQKIPPGFYTWSAHHPGHEAPLFPSKWACKTTVLELTLSPPGYGFIITRSGRVGVRGLNMDTPEFSPVLIHSPGK